VFKSRAGVARFLGILHGPAGGWKKTGAFGFSLNLFCQANLVAICQAAAGRAGGLRHDNFS
jgi:hypothetical protein